MKKNLLALLICISIILGLAPRLSLPVRAETFSGTCGKDGDNLIWTFNSSTGLLTITGSGEMADWDQEVFISSTSPWAAYCDVITAVSLPEGMTRIGKAAFYNCSALTSVTIPESVIIIDSDAFRACTNLSSVKIGCNVSNIKKRAFHECKKLKNITIPNSVTEIGALSFYMCTDLESVSLPESVTVVDDFAFQYCSGLRSVAFSQGLISIGNYSFWGCNYLTSVEIPASTASIGQNAFGKGEFYNDFSLTSLTVQNPSCTIFSSDYTLGLPGTTTIYGYPNSTAQTYADNYSYSFTELNNSNVISGTCGANLKWSLNTATGLLTITGSGPMTNYSGSPAAEAIHEPWEKYRSTIIDVSLPEGLTSIGNWAFYDCSNLNSVTIPDNVKSIGEFAFYEDSNLECVKIGENVSSIGYFAFDNCSKLSSIVIPGSVTSIGEDAFSGCSSLERITVDASNPNYSSDSSGVLLNKDQTTLIRCPGGYSGSYSVPSSVSQIKNSAFYACVDLTGITIPESVENIGARAFQNCTKLTAVSLPVSVVSIGDYAFTGCSSLKSIAIFNPDCSIPSYKNALGSPETTTIIGYKDSTAEEYANTYGYSFKELGEGTCQNGHAWDSFVVIIQPTCTEPGSQTKTCIFCGAAETETIDPLGHTFVDDVCIRCGITRFCLSADTWSFANRAVSFVDDPQQATAYCIQRERYDAVFGPSEAESRFSNTATWGGNCSGMVATALLFHAGKLNWDTINAQYENDFSCPNAYCYRLYRQEDVDRLINNVYVMSGKDQEPTRLIEEYQLFAAEKYQKYYLNVLFPQLVESFFLKTRVLSDSQASVIEYRHRPYSDGGHYIADALLQFQKAYESGMPLYLCLVYNGGQHAIVARNDIAPIPPGEGDDGWWKVCVYDPNRPFVNEQIIKDEENIFSILPSTFVASCNDEVSNGNDLYLELNVEENKWRYCASNRSDEECKYRGTSQDGEIQFVAMPESDSTIVSVMPEFFVIIDLNQFLPDGDCSHPRLTQDDQTRADPVGIQLDSIGETNCMIYDANKSPLAILCNGEAGMLSERSILLPTPGNALEDACNYSSVWLPNEPCNISYTNGILEISGNNNITCFEAGCAGSLSVDSQNNAISFTAEDEGAVHLKCANILSRDECSFVEAKGQLDAGQTFILDFDDDDNISYRTDGTGEVTLLYKASTDDEAQYYAVTSCTTCNGNDNCPGKVFIDMPQAGNWAHDAIDWAIVNGITSGTSATTFSPNAGCTRAQVVTFLWRAAGEPEPETTNNPFEDVKRGTWYYKAVLWAAETGVTAGTSATTFSPDATCTRAQIVTFLWRFEGEPAATSTNNSFADVKAGSYYEKAVLWAAETGVTAGTSATTFSPDATCTRAQVVTFLYRSSKNSEQMAAFNRDNYEIVIETCTWEEAREAAQAKGGKLVTFETAAEYRYVLNLIVSEADKSAFYYLGARRDDNGTTYHWIDKDNQLIGDPINGESAWCNSLWQAGEPNLEWNGNPETVAVLFFYSGEGRWCWYDGRADAVTSGRQYAYIVEYD